MSAWLIIAIVYAISFAIFLIMRLKDGKFEEHEPLWLYVLALLLMPIILFSAPFILAWEKFFPQKNKREKNTIEVEEGLPDNIYTKVAVAFAEAKYNNKFSSFRNYLSENIVLIIHGERQIVGKKNFVEYWEGVYQERDKEKNYTHTKVFMNLYCGHAVVWDFPQRGRKRVFLFRLENEKITHAAFVFDGLNADKGYHFDWERPRYQIGYLREKIEKPVQKKEHHVPCLSCGCPSEELDWFKVTTGDVPLQYVGEVSICPHCGRQVEFHYYEVRRTGNELLGPRRKISSVKNELNVYSAKGREAHMEFKNLVDSKKKDKGELFKVLDELSLKKLYHLGLYVAQSSHKQRTIDDESYFYIYNAVGGQVTDRYKGNGIMQYLQVAPTAMAAWQIYLLHTSPTVLPVWWHGGYILRTFIFALEDLRQFPMLDGIDLSVSTNSVLPEVEMKGNIAYVKCCYWNNWEGLVRETVKIVFAEGGVKSVTKVEQKILYKYNCGIRY